MSRFPFINVLFSAALAASASAVSAQEEPLIGPPEPQFSEAADSGNDTEKGENVAPDENIAGSIQLEGDTEEGYVSVGTGITPIKKIQSVQEVVLELMQDFVEK